MKSFRCSPALLLNALFALCFATNPALKAQNMIWAQHMARSVMPQGGNDLGRAIRHDALGNLYVAGTFEHTADLDPGPGSADLQSAGGQDIFVAKYSPAGEYRWAFRLGGPSVDYIQTIAVGADGFVYVAGSFSDSADFDPGPGTAWLKSNGMLDIFVAKYDANGRYVWAFNIGTDTDEHVTAIATGPGGLVYITGYLRQSMDMNPDSAVSLLQKPSAGENLDFFIAKYSDLGAYRQAVAMGGPDIEMPTDLVVSSGGNVYITGYFAASVDFNPGAGASTLGSRGELDAFVAIYNSSFDYVWAYAIGGPDSDYARSIAIDSDGSVFITGSFNGTIPDLDPGMGVQPLSSNGGSDVFIVKYDAMGRLQWADNLGGTGDDSSQGIALDVANGHAYITGAFSGNVSLGASLGNLVSGGGQDAYVAKYDFAGNLIWGIALGGRERDGGNSIAVSAMGNVSVTGDFKGSANFGAGANVFELHNPYNHDGFIAQYNASGAMRWAGQIGRYEFLTNVVLRRIAADAAGNIFATGWFSSRADFDPGPGVAELQSHGDQDIFLAKYNDAGQYLWAIHLGGTDTDQGHGVATDAMGNVYLTGYFRGTADFLPGPGEYLLNSAGLSDIFLAKYNTNGAFQWAFRLGGPSYDFSEQIKVGPNGQLYCTGYFYSSVDFDPGLGVATLNSAGAADFFIAKYDLNGNYINCLGRGGSSDDHAFDIDVDANDNVYVTGYFRATVDFDNVGDYQLSSSGVGDIFLAKYDHNLNYVWAERMGGAGMDNGHAIALDANGFVYVAGFFEESANFGTNTLSSAGGTDIFALKYNEAGRRIETVIPIGGPFNDIAYAMAVNNNGDFFLSGYFSDTVNFNPGTSRLNLISAGQTDAFMAKYNSSAALQWALPLGSSGRDYGTELLLDPNGNLYVAGVFTQELQFEAWNGSQGPWLSRNGEDAFIMKLGVFGVGIGEDIAVTERGAILYPNPARGAFRLRAAAQLSGTAQLILYDLSGRPCWQQNFLLQSGPDREFNSGNLAPGLYAWKLLVAGEHYSGRLRVD